jgi:putative ABC transport system permease protein
MRTFRDAQFAIRNLTRSPGFTAVVVLTLALGIGACTAIFSVVNAVVLRPLAYPEPQQLLRITSELRGFGAIDTGVSTPELADYQARTDLFAGVAGVVPVSANVTGGGLPERIEQLLVSWNYFAVLSVAPAYGRVFTAADEVPGVADLAVVSDGFWRRHLGGDPNAVGRTVTIDADAVLVVGVMPAGFHHPGRTAQNDVDVWSPAGFRGGGFGPPMRSRRRINGGLARLQPAVTLEQAQARLTEYGATVSQQFSSEYPPRNGWAPRAVSLQDDTVGGVAGQMFLLLAGVGLLLLIACANVANLVLARSSDRRVEMAIRQALGASAGRLTWQLLTESAVLAAAGGVLSLVVASWVLRGLIAVAPGRIPRLEDVTLDLVAVGVTGLIALGATVLFGLVPALQLRRVDTFSVVKEGGPGRSPDLRVGRARGFVVAVEVAMATMLLVGAGLLVRTVAGLVSVPLGFEPDHLLTARVSLPVSNDQARAIYLDHGRRVTFYRETLGRIAALPGVEQAAVSSQIPIGGWNAPVFIEIDGRDASDPNARPVIHSFQVAPSFFGTMGVRILRGRPFSDADRAGSETAVIVSATAARMFWKDQDPIGQRLRFAPGAPWMTIVGIAGDVLNRRLNDPPQPILYQTLEQASDMSMAFLIRTRGDAPGFAELLAREVGAVDPDVPIYAVRTMNEVIGSALAQRRFLMRLLVAFGALATGLALLGIYGVMAYSVSQRTREIGIRLAIGARQVDVSRMVMRRGLVLTGLGVLVGIAASLGLTKLITAQLFGVTPSDPGTLAAVVVLMTLVAAGAAYLPARRAARVDPIVALRTQ